MTYMEEEIKFRSDPLSSPLKLPQPYPSFVIIPADLHRWLIDKHQHMPISEHVSKRAAPHRFLKLVLRETFV